MILESILSYLTRRRFKGITFTRMNELKLPPIEEIGLYIHIPFCKELCSFCPYFKCEFEPALAQAYVDSVKKELELYEKVLGDVAISAIQFGGGTPSIIPQGIVEILDQIRESFSIRGKIGIEANPDDLEPETLSLFSESGIERLCIGVQSFHDDILKIIGRLSHDGKTAVRAIEVAMDNDFECVNVDLMFSLPSQTVSHLREDLEIAETLEPHQITVYPLLIFPYTEMAKSLKNKRVKLPSRREEKRLFYFIQEHLEEAGYEKCTVWSVRKQGEHAFSEKGQWIGLGASGASRVGNLTYWNTFSISEYIKYLKKGKLPFAVGRHLSVKQRMSHWLMMSLYELEADKSLFKKEFQADLEEEFKRELRLLRFLNIVKRQKDQIKVTNRGMYPMHIMIKTFLLSYVGRICEECLKTPFPLSFNI